MAAARRRSDRRGAEARRGGRRHDRGGRQGEHLYLLCGGFMRLADEPRRTGPPGGPKPRRAKGRAMTLLAVTTAVWIFILVPLIIIWILGVSTSSAATCPARRPPAGSSSSSCCRWSARLCTSCCASRPRKRSRAERNRRPRTTKERPAGMPRQLAAEINRRDPARRPAGQGRAPRASVASTNLAGKRGPAGP